MSGISHQPSAISHQSSNLLTHTLRTVPWGASAAEVLAAALAAADPAAAVRRYLRRDGTTLHVGDQAYDLDGVRRVLLVSIGKAGLALAQAAAEALGDALSSGAVVVKDPLPAGMPGDPRLRVLVAGHPVPDATSVAAAQAIADLLADTTADDLVLALISGGGSALVTLPAPGVTLADLQELTRALLACGATIGEINTLRKHLDRVKGGGLARLAAPARLATLILSDVVGSPLEVIASGPTVPDPSSFTDAWAVLERYDLTAQTPAAIRAHLEAGRRGAVAETPKPGDRLFGQVQNVLIGSNVQAAQAAQAAAQRAGMHTLLLTTFLEGEARTAGQLLAAVAREIVTSGNPVPAPACVIAGGETTVTLRGSGRGGRNQELALAAAIGLEGLPDAVVVALATDGSDGPTDAAGAVASGETLARATVLGLNAAAHLANNDAYPFFAALDDLLLPGPTGTNVNDLVFIFVGAKHQRS
jgi:hydroxypyruvate reductase